MSAAARQEEKKKGAPPVSFSLQQMEALQTNLTQALGQAASASGAAGAGGAGTVAAALASKVGMIVVVAMLGAGAMNMRRGNSLRMDMRARARAEKPHYSGDLSNLPTAPQEQDAIQGVVIGDMTRKGDEEAAEAEAAAKAQAEQQVQSGAAEDESAKAAQAMASANMTAAMKSGDLTAKAAKMPLGKSNSPFDKKFGALSTSVGGGGGGAATSAALSAASFKPAAPTMGMSRKLTPGQAVSGGRAISRAGVSHGGKAFGQLLNVNGLSRQGAQVGGEGGSSLADRGFSNGGSGGSAITGGGSGITGAGVMISNKDSSPNSASGNPINRGGGPAGTSAPPNAGHTNATPWQMFTDIAKWAMIIAGAAMLASFICAQMAKKASVYAAPAWLAAAQGLAGLAVAAGAVATLCGIAVLGMGQTSQGLMYTAGGALVGTLAYLQLTSEQDQSEKAKAALDEQNFHDDPTSWINKNPGSLDTIQMPGDPPAPPGHIPTDPFGNVQIGAQVQTADGGIATVT